MQEVTDSVWWAISRPNKVAPSVRSIAICLIFCTLFAFSTYRACVAADNPYATNRQPVTIYPAESVSPRNAEPNKTRVQKIEQLIEDAARQIRFSPGGGADSLAPSDGPPPVSNWFDDLVNLLGDLIDKVMRQLFDYLTPYVFSLVHNPNVASPYGGNYTIPFAGKYNPTAANGNNNPAGANAGVGEASVPYDLVGPQVKQGVKQGFAVVRAIAVSLLLLLFILTIWKYWKDAAWKNGQSLMGAVGRLIATTALIAFWPVISYHLVQISNEMIDYMFRSIDPTSFVQAMQRLSRITAQGQLLIILGQAFRVIGPVGNIVVNAATRTVGYFLGFFVFFVAIYQLVHLIILKAIQTGLMLAQFMFAPLFLVFFAAPDTERIATGFIRSCVEVSLWTFVWAGLMRLVVVILSSSEVTIWGDFIMLLGVFQIMLQVPDFIAHAKISHSSSFLTPLSAMRGFSAIGAALGQAGQQLWNHAVWRRGKDETPLSKPGENEDSTKLNVPGSDPGNGSGPTPGPKKKGPNPTGPANTNAGTPGTGPGTPGTTPPGNQTGSGPTLTTGTAPSTEATPPGKVGKDRFDPANADADKKSLESTVAELFEQEMDRRFGVSKGKTARVTHDGVKGATGLTTTSDMTPEEIHADYAKAAFAQFLMRNPGLRKAIGDKLGWAPDPLRTGTSMPEQEKLFNQAINEIATKGADAYVNGEKGNFATDLLRQIHGDMTPERKEALLAAMQDDGLAHSPFNPNFARHKQAVQGANLPFNPATMSWAASQEGSRLRGQGLNAGYSAMAGSLGRSIEAQGCTPGTHAYEAALGRAIAGTTPAKQRAAAYAGIGLLGTGEAESLTNEDWEAYVNETEKLATSHGLKSDVAFGALRSMMNIPDAVAHRASGASTANSVETAARAIAGMRESRVPPQAVSAEGFAGHMYNLAINDATGHNNLTQKNVLAALKTAQVKGFSNFSVPDSQIVETMLDADPNIGGWAAGEVDERSIELVKAVCADGGSASRRVCKRLEGARGRSAEYVAAARRSELDDLNPSQGGIAVNAIVDGVRSGGIVSALITGGHDGATEAAVAQISGLPTETVRDYAELARSTPGGVWIPEVVQGAHAIEALPEYRGNLPGAAYTLSTGMAALAAVGAHWTPTKVAGVMSTMVSTPGARNFGTGSYADGHVLMVVDSFDDAQRADPIFMTAAADASIKYHGTAYTREVILDLQNAAVSTGDSSQRLDQQEVAAYRVVTNVDPNVRPTSKQLHRLVLSGATAAGAGLGTHHGLTDASGAAIVYAGAELHAVMHSGMYDANPVLTPVLAAGVVQYAHARLQAAGTAVTDQTLIAEIDRMPETVVRACIVTQQRENAAACARVELVNHLAQSNRADSLPQVHAAYNDLQGYVGANATPQFTGGVGDATLNTIFNGGPPAGSPPGTPATSPFFSLYYEGGTAWDEGAAISVRQTILQSGIKGIEQIASMPSVMQGARDCYTYNPELLPHFITAIRKVGPEHANLGTAVLIKDLTDRCTWFEKDINYGNLVIAEQLRTQGVVPTMDNVQNIPPGLARPIVGAAPNHNLNVAQDTDLWT